VVNEIFLSIQGESRHAGLACTIVRLTGCNLRCTWCDTPYAYTEGEPMTLEAIMSRVGELGCKRVEVTGGEPLIQPAVPQLLRKLCDAGYITLLETNGSLDVGSVDPRVVKIVDVKCPSSGHVEANLWENLAKLTEKDEIKFVIADRRDYVFACRTIQRWNLRNGPAVTFSPVHGEMSPVQLAEWILADALDVRLGLQLHKIIWPGRTRGV